MKFKKTDTSGLKFKRVNDPRLLGTEKEKARSQYSKLSSFIPEPVKEPSAFEKFTESKFVKPIAENYKNLGTALTSGMGNVNIGTINALRTLNAPVSYAASKLDELVTGKKVAPMSDPISRKLTSVVEEQEKAVAPYQERMASITGPQKYIYGAVESVPQILPALTGAGQAATLGSIGASAFGSGARQAEKEGASLGQQFLAGGASAGIEVGTEALPIKNLLKFTKGKGSIIDLAKNSLEEMFGEAAAEAASPLIENIYKDNATKEAYTTNLNQTAKQILDAGITGAVASVLIGGSALGVNIDNAVANPTPENIQVVKDEVARKTNIVAPSFGQQDLTQPSAEQEFASSLDTTGEFNVEKARASRLAQEQSFNQFKAIPNEFFEKYNLPKPTEVQAPIEEAKVKEIATEEELINVSKEKPSSITIPYRKNIEKAPQMEGFGQEIEPSGNYINFHEKHQRRELPNIDYGEITFNNPMYVDYINTDSTGWKKNLSEKYNGLTGKELSEAIKADGYDAIVTLEDNKYVNEIVDLTESIEEKVAIKEMNEETLEAMLNEKGLDEQSVWNGLDNLESLSAINKSINDDGTVTLYHKTDIDSANNIVDSQKMIGKEDGIFFSTNKDGQADGFGDTTVEVNVPIEELILDDEFDNELHFRVPTKRIGDSVSVKAKLSDTTQAPTTELQQPDTTSREGQS